MYKILSFLPILLTFCTQAQTTDAVKKELRELLTSLSDARIKHDKPALDRIYADEFIFIHSSGFIQNKATIINEIMNTDSIRAMQLPDFANLIIYDNVAVLRQPANPVGNTVISGTTYGTFIYVRKAGRWQIAQAQGTALQPERKRIQLDPDALDAFTGKYERMGQTILITRNDSTLLLNMVNRGIPKRKLSPVSDTRFFDDPGTEYNFSKDEKGHVTQFIAKFATGQQSEWKKTD